MNNKRATKRALLTSVMALVMCVVMLVGTTFAWFTDTASTGVNKIQAGNLDVDIIGEDGKSLDGKTLSFKNVNDKTDILWEPGATFFTQGFQIVNKGNLALKYKVVVSGTTGDAKLLEAIDFAVVTDNTKKDAEAVSFAEEGKLLNKGDTAPESAVTDAGAKAYYYLRGHMKEEAGNEYKNLTMDGISITVYATQYTHENDSFGPDYDKNATYYPVLDAAGMKDALVNGGNIKVDANVDPSEALVATKDTTIDMNGKTIANTNDVWDVAPNSWSLISARENADLTITGNGTFKAKENDCYAVDVQDVGATVTIENGTFIGNIHAVYVYEGTANIKGGFYSVQQKYTDASKADEFVLNCYDANRANGTAKIIVTGGTFVNFNPADCWAEGEHTNFVAPGYSVITETKANGDKWYTVVKGTGVTAGTQEALKDAITKADTTSSNALTVKLADGEYTLYNVDKAKTQNTELTIEGAGKDKTVFTAGDMTVTDANGEGSSDYSYEGSDVTFKNMTVNVGKGNYKGFVRAKSLYFENCTIEGRGSYWGIGSVVFKDCIFNSVNDYNIWTYAGMDFTFDNCTFNSDAGKFVNAYKEEATGTTKLTFTDCKFVAGTENKPAVCLKGYKSNAWNVTFSGCSLTNCKTDATTGSNYYLLDQGIENATTVTIDGKVVWENGAKK